MSTTATDLREQAAEREQASRDSFDRCDTDGFLSQWASDISARRLRLQADIVDNGGRAAFPALFDAEGNLVAAKLIETRYGLSWGLLDSDDAHGRFVGWFNRSHARKGATRLRNDLAKGYTQGLVLAPAKADICGSGTGLAGAASASVAPVRTDGGFSRDVEVVTTQCRYDVDL